MQITIRHLPAVPAGLLVDAVEVEPTGVVLAARPVAKGAGCPACGTLTDCVHSHDWRTLADLPRHDRRVTWRFQVRRFRCGTCERCIFAERLPNVARKGRRTGRLAMAQASIGLALGGESGARLASELPMPVVDRL